MCTLVVAEEKKNIREKNDKKEIPLFENRKIKVELRNRKALPNMQLSFPVFFLEHALRKVVKENSAVSFGDPRGFLSCTAVIWLALTTMTHQTVNLFSHSESTASPTIKEEGVRQSVCAKMNISNCSIQVHFAALWESKDHIYFMANMSSWFCQPA